MVLARNGLEVHGGEGGVGHEVGHELLRASLRLGDHGLADIRGGDEGASVEQREGERADAAAGVAHGEPVCARVLIKPFKHGLDGLGVAVADVELHLVDLTVLRVDAVPAIKALVVEVLGDDGLVVDARGHAHGGGDARRTRRGRTQSGT